jgi:uncharacterized protein YbjT (DUF2867 family)
MGALLLDASRADSLPDGIDIAVGNLDDPDSLTSALRGIKSVFLVNEMFRAAWSGRFPTTSRTRPASHLEWFASGVSAHVDKLR